jgi:CRISPR-associated protein Csm5
MHRRYAEWAGLKHLGAAVDALQQKLDEVRSNPDSCLVSMGWGGGFLSKAAFLNTRDESYRQILKQVSVYARAIQSGLPFPKTRRIVFQNGEPATLPGWVLLEVNPAAAQ